MRCASLVTLWKPTTAAAPLRVCALRRMSLSVGRSPGVRSSTTSDALTVRRCSSASSRKISSISGSMSSSAGASSRPSLPKLRGSGPRSSGEPSNTNASPNEATRGSAASGECARVRRRHVGDDGEPLFDLVELTQHLGAAIGRQRAADERELLEDVLGAPRERAELVEADHRRRTRDGVGQPVGGLDLGRLALVGEVGEHPVPDAGQVAAGLVHERQQNRRVALCTHLVGPSWVGRRRRSRPCDRRRCPGSPWIARRPCAAAWKPCRLRAA